MEASAIVVGCNNFKDSNIGVLQVFQGHRRTCTWQLCPSPISSAVRFGVQPLERSRVRQGSKIASNSRRLKARENSNPITKQWRVDLQILPSACRIFSGAIGSDRTLTPSAS